jgi:hypothetical protein
VLLLICDLIFFVVGKAFCICDVRARPRSPEKNFHSVFPELRTKTAMVNVFSLITETNFPPTVIFAPPPVGDESGIV